MARRAGVGPIDPLQPLTDRDEEAAGDPACWAHRVCQECGRLSDAERPARCDACGATFPTE